MNTKSLFCAAALAALTTAGAAQAATVSATQTQVLVFAGQDFTFTFGGLAPSDGSGGTLTIASGISQSNPGGFDGIDIAEPAEFFSVNIDGTSFGNYSCAAGAGNTVIAGSNIKSILDCEFSLPLALTGMQLDQFLADGSITAFINFSDAVDPFNDLDELVVSLSYVETAAVPLPASGLLLLGAFGGMVANRRRRRS